MKFVRDAALVVTACMALAAASALMSPQYSRAQFSSQSSWIPASGVGGGANAITLAVPNIVQLSDILGVPLRFLPTNVNAAGSTTINPASLGALAVKRNSAGALVGVAGGDVSTSVMAEVMYDGTQFVQTNPATGNAPVGSEISVTAGAAAIAGYLIENGTCISQTTYAALWAFYGSVDVWTPGSTGGACPGGQFHLPFANGSASIAADTQGGVTAGKFTGSGCSSTVSSHCGAQQQTIAQGNIPSYTLPNTLGTTHNLAVFNTTVGGANNEVFGVTGGTFGSSNTFSTMNGGIAGGGQLLTITGAVSVTGSVTSGGGASPLLTVQPSYIVLRQVKY